MASRHPNLIETTGILLASCALMLVVCFVGTTVAGKPTFENLPAWVTSAAGSVWPWLASGAGGGILIRIGLRSRQDEHPNYIAWIFATTALLVGMVCVIALSSKGTSADLKGKVVSLLDEFPADDNDGKRATDINMTFGAVADRIDAIAAVSEQWLQGNPSPAVAQQVNKLEEISKSFKSVPRPYVRKINMGNQNVAGQPTYEEYELADNVREHLRIMRDELDRIGGG